MKKNIIARQKKGISSMHLHDPKMIFKELDLKPGQTFLDLGCGAGDYALAAAGLVGEKGEVYAWDKWPEVAEKVKQKADSLQLTNIKTAALDISGPLPLKDSCIDICFMSTVLHIFDLEKTGPALFKEISRILKPEGVLAVIEIKKEETPFGPPMPMRISPEELEQVLLPFCFKKLTCLDMEYTYLARFALLRGND